MSDPHVDFKYQEGSVVDCGLPVCCRGEKATGNQTAAGKFGSYGSCDIPLHSFETIIKFIADDIKPDSVMWSGDNTPHDIWENTQKEVLDSTRNLTKFIQKSFSKEKIPVFPVLGNHDNFPVNL